MMLKANKSKPHNAAHPKKARKVHKNTTKKVLTKSPTSTTCRSLTTAPTFHSPASTTTKQRLHQVPVNAGAQLLQNVTTINNKSNTAIYNTMVKHFTTALSPNNNKFITHTTPHTTPNPPHLISTQSKFQHITVVTPTPQSARAFATLQSFKKQHASAKQRTTAALTKRLSPTQRSGLNKLNAIANQHFSTNTQQEPNATTTTTKTAPDATKTTTTTTTNTKNTTTPSDTPAEQVNAEEQAKMNIIMRSLGKLKGMFQKYGKTLVVSFFLVLAGWFALSYAFVAYGPVSPQTVLDTVNEYFPKQYEYMLTMLQKHAPTMLLDLYKEQPELCLNLAGASAIVSFTDTPRYMVTFWVTKKIYDAQQNAKKFSQPPPKASPTPTPAGGATTSSVNIPTDAVPPTTADVVDVVGQVTSPEQQQQQQTEQQPTQQQRQRRFAKPTDQQQV